MSVSGTQETFRAHVTNTISSGGGSGDFAQLQADEDREIIAITYGDSSRANVGGEVSFSSSRTIGSSSDTDAARSSVLVISYEQVEIQDMSVTWNAGEEIHFHGVNNSGSDEDQAFVIHYREL